MIYFADFLWFVPRRLFKEQIWSVLPATYRQRNCLLFVQQGPKMEIRFLHEDCNYHYVAEPIISIVHLYTTFNGAKNGHIFKDKLALKFLTLLI